MAWRIGGFLLIGGATVGAVVGIAILVGQLSSALAYALLAFVAVTWGLGFHRLEAVESESLGRQQMRNGLRRSKVASFVAFLDFLLLAWTASEQYAQILTALPIGILTLVAFGAGVTGTAGVANALRERGGQLRIVGRILAIAVFTAIPALFIGIATDLKATLWVALASLSTASLLLGVAGIGILALTDDPRSSISSPGSMPPQG